MDNLPKENEDQNQSSTGEIFSSDQVPISEETITNQTQSIQTQEQYLNEQPPEEYSPPPFVEDNRKKFMVIGIIAVIILFVVVSTFLLLFKKPKPKPVENITLTYWGLWEEKEIIQPLIDEYKKSHSNIIVNYIKQDPKQYRERLQTAIEKGEGPDIFRFHNTWIPMLNQVLTVMPKIVYSEEEFKKTFYPVASDDLKIEGNIYGIPLEIDGLLLFYNEDMFKSAALTVPKTWSDVQKAVSKLTVKEKEKIVTAGIALGTAENVEHFSDIVGLMLLQNGVQPVNSLFSCADKSSTTCAVEALSFYRKFAETPNNVWDETLDNSITAFSGGKVAMIFAPSWQINTIKTISPSLNFKVVSVPQLPCEKEPCPAINWANYWIEGVSSKSKNQAASWEFLKFLSQADSEQKIFAEQVKYRKLFGEPYSRVDLGNSLKDNPYLAPLIGSAPTMKSFYSASRTFDGETGLNSSINKYLKDAINSLSQGTSVETALKTADNGFKQVYSRFGITAPTK